MAVQPQEVEPSSGPLIVGLVAIGAMFNRHHETISRWVRTEDLPAAQMPNGTYITSPTLVDEWLPYIDNDIALRVLELTLEKSSALH